MIGSANMRTERLALRPLLASDAADFVAGLNCFDVARWLAAPPWPYAQADFTAFLLHGQQGRYWVIEDAAGFCGMVSLAPHLGYWLAPRAQGVGYATEASRAVLGAYFATPDAGPLRSGYFEGNAASARVLAKLGFLETSRHPEYCRSRDCDLPHVDMVLSRAAYAEANPFVLKTPRLTLDPVTEADAPAIRRIVTDPRVGQMLFVFAPDLSAAEARDFARNWRWTGTPPFRLALRLNGAFIGAIGLKSLTDPEIYYFLAPEHHGRGYLSEVLAEFIAAISERFALTRLTAKVFTDNPASARLLENNGFRPGTFESVSSPARSGPATVRLYHRP
jgi:RimJ/RimL family protein N-acetyltransferase